MTVDEIKLALRVTSEVYEPEIRALAMAGIADLQIAGITAASSLEDLTDPLECQAVKTYVRAHFGSPADYDRLAASYETQKAQLMHATGHTTW
jgi:acyl CoA:acetate/3-ketoacid CoA transferase alpha subunit